MALQRLGQPPQRLALNTNCSTQMSQEPAGLWHWKEQSVRGRRGLIRYVRGRRSGGAGVLGSGRRHAYHHALPGAARGDTVQPAAVGVCVYVWACGRGRVHLHVCMCMCMCVRMYVCAYERLRMSVSDLVFWDFRVEVPCVPIRHAGYVEVGV